jgi:hypothetical protein
MQATAVVKLLYLDGLLESGGRSRPSCYLIKKVQVLALIHRTDRVESSPGSDHCTLHNTHTGHISLGPHLAVAVTPEAIGQLGSLATHVLDVQVQLCSKAADIAWPRANFRSCLGTWRTSSEPKGEALLLAA